MSPQHVPQKTQQNQKPDAHGITNMCSLSVTIAGHLKFWDLQKDMSLTPEFRQQAMTVKKIHLGINHEVTIGFLTENQSAFHYSDAIKADARAKLTLGCIFPSQCKRENFL